MHRFLFCKDGQSIQVGLELEMGRAMRKGEKDES